jgi:hypothetical protein
MDTIAATVPHSGAACGRDRQPLVERTAFVRFDVRERDMAQANHRHDVFHRFQYQREQLTQAGVEEQGFVVVDQVLVE